MKELKLKKALTTDRHFRQMGFEILPAGSPAQLAAINRRAARAPRSRASETRANPRNRQDEVAQPSSSSFQVPFSFTRLTFPFNAFPRALVAVPESVHFSPEIASFTILRSFMLAVSF